MQHLIRWECAILRVTLVYETLMCVKIRTVHVQADIFAYGAEFYLCKPCCQSCIYIVLTTLLYTVYVYLFLFLWTILSDNKDHLILSYLIAYLLYSYGCHFNKGQ